MRFREDHPIREAIDYLAGEDMEYAPIAKSNELRYTLGPVYSPGVIDAHGEFTDSEALREAVWNYARAGDRRLRKQHTAEVIGDVVEMFQWPFDHSAELRSHDGKLQKVKLPAGTVYAGVVWSSHAWPLVKSGKISGYSMGGGAVRLHNAADDGDLLKFE